MLAETVVFFGRVESLKDHFIPECGTDLIKADRRTVYSNKTEPCGSSVNPLKLKEPFCLETTVKLLNHFAALARFISC